MAKTPSLGNRPRLAEVYERSSDVHDFFNTNDRPKSVTRLWVGIKPISAQDVTNADQIENLGTHQLTARYVDGIRPDMWLVISSRGGNAERVFQIKSAINFMEEGAWLVMQCIESERG